MNNTTQHTMKTIFETGATSHAVNELILYIDATKRLAVRRDEIYKKYVTPSPRLVDWYKSMTKEFEKVLLPLAIHQYRMKLGEELYEEICCNMSQPEHEEFGEIYARRFYNWKAEHGYK